MTINEASLQRKYYEPVEIIICKWFNTINWLTLNKRKKLVANLFHQ